MLFHEVYGLYFQAVARILSAAQSGTLSEESLREIAAETAFSESAIAIEAALKSQRWPLVLPNGATPVRHPPVRGLTLLERRWLSTVAQDPRIKLFGDLILPDPDAPPLFSPEAFIVYDQSLDGDPYDSPDYIARFRTILTAMRENRRVKLAFYTSKGSEMLLSCQPYRLEYSRKDDKFRLVTHGKNGGNRINLSRIVSADLGPICQAQPPAPRRKKRTCTLELKDERNALERAMIHFSDLEKRTESVGEGRYRMTLGYECEDETEIVIRVLSFGPMLRALAPERFVNLVRSRIQRQLALFGRE